MRNRYNRGYARRRRSRGRRGRLNVGRTDLRMAALNRYYIARAVDHSIDWITDPVTSAKALVWSTSIEDIQIDRAGGF